MNWLKKNNKQPHSRRIVLEAWFKNIDRRNVLYQIEDQNRKYYQDYRGTVFSTITQFKEYSKMYLGATKFLKPSDSGAVGY